MREEGDLATQSPSAPRSWSAGFGSVAEHAWVGSVCSSPERLAPWGTARASPQDATGPLQPASPDLANKATKLEPNLNFR